MTGHIYCDNCQTVRPLVLSHMPADGHNDHAATDLLCGECCFVIATLHHLDCRKPLTIRFDGEEFERQILQLRAEFEQLSEPPRVSRIARFVARLRAWRNR